MERITDTFTGLDWLKIDIANTYGKDKETWEKRLEWVNDRTQDKLWSVMRHADEPLLYRKALIAYRDVLAGKPTGHIMHLDSVNSGYQMMAMMSGCKKTAAECGLVDTGVRPDLYTSTVKYMNKELEGDNKISLAKKPTNGRLSRAELKDAVMTHAYKSRAVPRRVFNKTQLPVFYSVLSDITPGAEAVKDLISEYISEFRTEYNWISHNSSFVSCRVKDTVDARIEIDELDHGTFTQRYQVNKAKKGDVSLVANITHYMDALVLDEVVIRCPFDITVIHDSYGVHPNNAGELVRIYREVVAEFSRVDMLSDILTDISGDEVQVTKFSYDLHIDILNSSYMLS